MLTQANHQAWELVKRGYVVIAPSLGAFYPKAGEDLSWEKWLRHDEDHRAL